MKAEAPLEQCTFCCFRTSDAVVASGNFYESKACFIVSCCNYASALLILSLSNLVEVKTDKDNF